ncbi:MAG: Extradiol ring-cleavage dioxygenase class protein subunit [Holophagaceae bacterium]|nr:Extradiol ring-cleavage dioxygenase class protein subunit [Holophagaceae bacterium]
MPFLAPCAAALMCHAPIVIPAVSGDRGFDCAASTRAMAEAARVLVAAKPATVVVLSPHAPRHQEAFTWKSGSRWVGSLAPFGWPGLRMNFAADMDSAEALAHAAVRNRVPLDPSEDGPLDHGALVPLWFLREAGYEGPVLVLGFPWRSSNALMECFALALGEAMGELGRTWALVASGDMSHRLLPGAPSGFHPRAGDFDQAVLDCVRAGRPGDVAAISGELRDLAAEDVTESLMVAAPLIGSQAPGHRFLSYEGPFGVGYLIAILRNEAV